MEHNAKNICRTVTSGKEQNLDKQMDKLGICFQHFIYSIFWPNSTHIQDLENRFYNSILYESFNTAWDPAFKPGPKPGPL